MNPPPLSEPITPHSDLAQRGTLQTVTLVVAVSALLLAPYLYFFSATVLNAISPVFIATLALICFVLLRSRRSYLVPHLMVFGVQAGAVAAIVAHGSIRSSGVVLFIGAVAGAGIFLGRTAFLVAVAISTLSLTALLLAEQNGLITATRPTADYATLLTHLLALYIVAIMVYHSRRSTLSAHRRLIDELQARRKTEAERDRSLDRFARIFHNNPSPMLAQSARNGMILDANPAFERCFGYSREQLLGRTDAHLWADPAQREHYHQRLFTQRRAEHERVTGLRADGSTFEAQVASEMGSDPEDRLIITTVADTSAQHQAMERLRRSEERFAKAFNFSPLKMTITRLSDGTFLEVNQARDPVQGLRRHDLVGKTTLETGGWLNPQERQAFIDIIRRDGHVSAYETRMRHADGQVIDAKMWAELIEIDGEDCILSCFINTTDEKRREAQLIALSRGMAGPSGDALFRALTLHMAQAIGADMVTVSELKDDGRLRTLAVWRDGAASRNYTTQATGSPCETALAQTNLCTFESGLAEHFAHHPDITGQGLQAYMGQSLRDEDGSPIGLLNAFWRRPVQLGSDARALIAIFASRANAELVRLRRDREIQRLNASLEQRVRVRTAELEKLNAELDSFAYSVSNDLKSPLRAIDGFTQLLQESLGDRLTPAEHDTFGRVLAATHRMAKLIADLLALARVSQGALDIGPVNLSEMALHILQDEQRQQGARRLHWRVTPGLVAQCDARLLRIALENLIGNAVKYTRDQPEPLIEFGRLDEPGQAPQFFVRDNGCGFDMAHAGRLFQPFQRLHMPSSGFEGTGTGIGLATVRRIVERHGGHIQGKGEPGAGALFRFSLASDPIPLPAPHNPA